MMASNPLKLAPPQSQIDTVQFKTGAAPKEWRQRGRKPRERPARLFVERIFDATQLVAKRLLDALGTSLAAGYATDQRTINAELAGDTAEQTTVQGIARKLALFVIISFSHQR
jgi:hypothetical protein